MASLLDMLLGGQGGVLGGLPTPNDPAWEAIRRLAQGDQSSLGPPRYNPDPYQSPVDLRTAGGGFGVPPGPATMPRGADTFGRGAQPIDVYGSTGFGIPPPPSPQPGPVAYPPTAAQPAPSLGPPIGVSPVDRGPMPTTAPPSRGGGVPNTVAAPATPAYAPPQATGPDIGGNLTAGLMNVLHNPFSPQGIGDLITGLTTGTRTDPVGASTQIAQRTYQTLREAGYSHPDAVLGATNPAVLNEMVKNAYQQPKFEKAGPGESAYLVGGGQGRLGPGGGGPSGVSGAGVTMLQPGLSVAENKAQEVQGQAMGEARAALPKTLTTADQALRTIDELKAHPGKTWATGMLGVVPAIPGTAQGDFVQKLKQAQGQTFLAAYAQLRGGGAISNVEGQKGTEAVTNLSRAQTPAAFDKALDELRTTVSQGRENAIKIARGEMEPYPTTEPQPAKGTSQVGGNWTTGKVGGQPYRIRQVQ